MNLSVWNVCSIFYCFLLVAAGAHNNAKTLFLLQKKSDVYSIEISGIKDLEKTETGDEEKYKDLKGNKKKKNEDLKKELDLVSVAKLQLHLAF